MHGIFDGDHPDDEPPRLDWDDDLPDRLPTPGPARAKESAERWSQEPLQWAAGVAAMVALAVTVFGATSPEPGEQGTPSARLSDSASTSGSTTAPKRTQAPATESASERSGERPSATAASTSADRSAIQLPARIRSLDATWNPLEALSSLPVVEEGTSMSATPYDRAFFGQEWMDVDRNGCDTRNDILRRDLDDLVVKEGTQGCVAYSGSFVDPYTTETFYFERGSGNAGELHVDHIVALSDAWHKGAANWNDETRVKFANDPMNLVVTFGDVNLAKGADDAGDWLPPNKAAHCAFAVRVVWVKDRYNLAVAQDEATALGDVLGGCGGHYPELVGDR